MNNFTEEQITRVVKEVVEEISENTTSDFLDVLDKKLKELPEDLKNNPLVYHEMAIAYTQGNVAVMIKEILCRLLCDEKN